MLLHILIPAENLHVHLPYVAKSYFETYKSYDHMKNYRPLSQKFSEISKFEKFELMRFLGARAPLGIARVKRNITKKFQIAITCSLLFLLAP